MTRGPVLGVPSGVDERLGERGTERLGGSCGTCRRQSEVLGVDYLGQGLVFLGDLNLRLERGDVLEQAFDADAFGFAQGPLRVGGGLSDRGCFGELLLGLASEGVDSGGGQ